MTLNGTVLTGDGETESQDCAQGPGTPLPLRPARASANDASSWKPPGPVVSPRAADGPTDLKGSAPHGPMQANRTDT